MAPWKEASPQTMAGVGSDRFELSFRSVQRVSQIVIPRHPEVMVEPVLKLGGLGLQAPPLARHPKQPAVEVGLDLAQRDGVRGGGTVDVADGIVGVLPALVSSTTPRILYVPIL